MSISTEANIQLLYRIMDSIENRYDPENDASNVTWADQRLLILIAHLHQRIIAIENELASIDRVLRASLPE